MRVESVANTVKREFQPPQPRGICTATPLSRKHRVLKSPLGIWCGCADRIGTGPPQARTEVIYVDLEYWAVSGLIHPGGDLASRGTDSSVFRVALDLVRAPGARWGCKAIGPPTIRVGRPHDCFSIFNSPLPALQD